MKYRNSKIGFEHYQSLCNLANLSVAMLPRYQLNFRAMRWLWYCILRFREFFLRWDVLQNNAIESMNSLPQNFLVTRLLTTCTHRAAPLSSDWPEPGAGAIFSSKTAWQLFNLGRFKEICIPRLLCHVGLGLHANCISHSWHRLISR